MNYHLDCAIRLSEDSEHKSVYRWSLQEVDEHGKQIGRDQIPWEWSFWFTAGELNYCREIERDKPFRFSKQVSEEPTEITDTEVIRGTLYPGTYFDGRWQDDTRYSFFGTKRRVSSFGLRIIKLDEEVSEEDCRLLGILSYTSEIDFVYEITEDIVEVNLWLLADKFDRLAEMILLNQADEVKLYLTDVSGFYSESSPSISTDEVKILATGEEQEISGVENCEIEPPRLGKVGGFNLLTTKRMELNLKQDKRPVNIDKMFSNDEVDDDSCRTIPRQADTNAEMLRLLIRNESAISKLRAPLWICAGLLSALLLKMIL